MILLPPTHAISLARTLSNTELKNKTHKFVITRKCPSKLRPTSMASSSIPLIRPFNFLKNGIASTSG